MNKMMFAKILAEKKKSQKEMALELNMSPQRLSDMLAGRLSGWKYRSRICRYLGVPEEILFHEDGDKQKTCQN